MTRAALALFALALLAGCGLRGSLERPPPMWGETREAYEAEERAKAETAAPATETEADDADAPATPEAAPAPQ